MNLYDTVMHCWYYLLEVMNLVIKRSNTRVTFVLPKDAHETLKEIAEYEGRTVSNLLQIIVKDYIDNNSTKYNNLK